MGPPTSHLALSHTPLPPTPSCTRGEASAVAPDSILSKSAFFFRAGTSQALGGAHLPAVLTLLFRKRGGRAAWMLLSGSGSTQLRG